MTYGKKTWLAILSLLLIPLTVLASVTVNVNGSNYTIPQPGEKGWGNNVTTWIQAISANTLQPSGGQFNLISEVDFGATYGLKSVYFKSRALNPATVGGVRLGSTESVGWRNAANNGNLLLTVNGSDQLTFNGTVLASSSGASFQDSTFSIFDNSDTSKILNLQLSGISTGQTRTLTVPDASTTIVGTDTTQTLTNKTLSSPVINTPTGIVKGDVGLGSVDNTSDAAKPISTAQQTALDLKLAKASNLSDLASPTTARTNLGLGNVDNTSDATKNSAVAVLTNKDIDGGTASNANRLTLPKNTKANLDALTRKAGTIVYATDTLKPYHDNGTSLVAIGSGSGSGGINYVTNSDIETDLTGWRTFTNAVNFNSLNGSSTWIRAGLFAATLNVGDAVNVIYREPGAATLALDTTYYVASVAGSAYTFSATRGGSAIVATGAYQYLVGPLKPVDGTTVVDGLGNGPTLTIARSTSSPLAGTASLVVTKPASNTAGQGVSYDFTIDRGLQGQQLAINFLSEVASGTYASGDLTAWIYDVTNNTVIQPSAYVIGHTTIPGPVQPMVFQAASNSTSYRLVFHSSSASLLAYTLKLDNISVGPQVATVAPAATDWVAYTPTGTWTTNATYTGFWKRVGDTMLVRAQVSLSGAPSGTFSLNLPTGYSIDTTKLGSGLFSYGQNFGTATALVSGSAWEGGGVGYGSATSVGVWILASGTTNAFTQLGPTTPGSFQNADYVWLDFKVPIVGWSSNTIVSDSAASRSVTLRASGSPNSTITDSVWSTITWASSSSVGKDDVGGYVATTGLYTVKIPGTYKWQGNVEVARSSGTATQAVALRVNKNSGGAFYYGARSSWISSGSEGLGNSAGGQFEAVAGDVIKLEIYAQGSGLAWNSGVTASNFQLQLDQGPSQIQAATDVSASYSTTSGQSIPASTPTTIVWNTKIDDSHGIVNTSTGVITIPAPGKYTVSAIALFGTATFTLAGANNLMVYKNGVLAGFIYINSIQFTGSQNPLANFGSVDLRCLAGDTIDIRIQHTEGSARVLNNTANTVQMNIKRVNTVN